jgi:hypothetical protein
MGEYIFSGNGPLHNLYSFLCLSLPTRGTPHLYRNTDAPRLYRNTFFLLFARHKTFLGTVETRRAACRQQIATGKKKHLFLEQAKKHAACHTKRGRIVFAALSAP